jgi:hypothetical protein
MAKRKGFLLVSVMLIFLFLMIIVPVMVYWIQNDTKISMKNQKSTLAFNLAEAAVDRGYWEVKGSTATFAQISAGGTLAGYRFDTTYSDISGGTYRINVTSGPNINEVTILGEGRDSLKKETRAIKAVYLNSSVAGPIITAGKITLTAESVVHWGPIMAGGDITVPSGAVHFPRKLSRQTVKPLDPTGDTNPPNTDNKEWWSDYNVPDLPVFDFSTMRASAAATGTLDCQDVTSTTYTTSISTTYTPSPLTCTYSHNTYNNSCSSQGTFSRGYFFCSGSGSCVPTYTTYITTSTHYGGMQCCHSSSYGGPVTCDYGDGATPCTDCTVCDFPGEQYSLNNTALEYKDYTWFWDNNFTVNKNIANNCSNNQISVKGTVVVLGNMSTSSTTADNYPTAGGGPVLKVPPQAWREYQYLDTTSKNEYPADTISISSNAANYTLGSCGTLCETGGISSTLGTGGDLGIYGFVYVKGNLALAGDCDIYGAVWVDGNLSGMDNAIIFYNSNLKVPTLNVVLGQETWQETSPNNAAWQ